MCVENQNSKPNNQHTFQALQTYFSSMMSTNGSNVEGMRIDDMGLLQARTKDELLLVYQRYVDYFYKPFAQQEGTLLDRIQQVLIMFHSDRPTNQNEHAVVERDSLTHVENVLILLKNMQQFGLLDRQTEAGKERHTNILTILEHLHFKRQILLSMASLHTVDASIVANALTMSEKKLTNVQKYTSYMYQVANLHAFQQDGKGGVYETIRNSENEHTTAVRYVCTMMEFVQRYTPKEFENAEIWRCAISHGSTIFRKCADIMIAFPDEKFPIITKNRYKFEFRNGMFYTNQCRFVCKEDYTLADVRDAAVKYWDVDMDFDGMMRQMHSRCAADAPCQRQVPEFQACETGDPLRVSTPLLQSVIDFQYGGAGTKDSEAMSRVIYGLVIGRSLEGANVRDEWKVYPLLLGPSGCGKSTISDTVTEFYDKKDIGTIENKTNKRSVAASLSSKLLIYAGDVKETNNWDPVMIKRIVCDEAETVKPHLIMCAKKKPLRDVNGCLEWYELVIPFTQSVSAQNRDETLGQRIRAHELPALLFKAAFQYDWYVRRFGSRDIWNAIPDVMVRFIRNLLEPSNSLVGFLNSNIFEHSQDMYMPFVDFEMAYHRYCFKTRKALAPLVPENYQYVFDLYSIRVEHTKLQWPPGSDLLMDKNWLRGVRFVSISAFETATTTTHEHSSYSQTNVQAHHANADCVHEQSKRTVSERDEDENVTSSNKRPRNTS